MRAVGEGARLAVARGGNFGSGLWRLADPKISPASVASMALMGLVGAPFALAAAWRLLRAPEVTARVVPAQAWMLSGFVLAASGAASGLTLSGGAAVSGGSP